MNQMAGSTPPQITESRAGTDEREALHLDVRPARAEDVPLIFENIGYWASQGRMLVRPMQNIFENLRDFFVALRGPVTDVLEYKGHVLGAGVPDAHLLGGRVGGGPRHGADARLVAHGSSRVAAGAMGAVAARSAAAAAICSRTRSLAVPPYERLASTTASSSRAS